MKRKNLFLSLISSIVVAVAIVTITIVSVASPKKKNDVVDPGTSNIGFETDYSDYEEENTKRDGSEGNPYLIYSAESYNALLGEYGSQGRYFQVAEDIDFTDVDYVTLFNGDRAMNSTINGNGHSLTNITIHATKENINQYTYDTYAYIALFGKMNGAVIDNLNIANLEVVVDADVYDYVKDFESTFAYDEVLVSSIACVAQNTTFSNVTLNSKVTGFSYNVGSKTENSIGGVVAVGEKLTITDSKIDTEINVNNGTGFHMGGIAGYGRVATVKNTDVDVKATIASSNRLNFGGLFSYGKTLTIENANVNVDLKTIDSSAIREAFVNGIRVDENGLANAADMSFASGLVAFLRADDKTQKSTFSNIKVTSNVDADLVYAGAFLDTWTTDPTNTSLVLISDVVVDVNADVLALHGFARGIGAATVQFSDEAKAAEGYYNIKMTGSVKLKGYFVEANSKVYSRPNLSIWIGISTKYGDKNVIKFNINDFHVVISENLYNVIWETSSSFDFYKLDAYNNNKGADSVFGSVTKIAG